MLSKEERIKEGRIKGGRAAAKVVKEKYLKRYLENPKHCLYCGEAILPRENCKLKDIKLKKFCNGSCAGKYNNKARGFTLKHERIPKIRIRVYGVDEGVIVGSLYGKGSSKYALIRAKARSKMNFYKVEKKCAVCEYNTHVEIHHKKFLSTYPDDTLLSVVNDLENLVYLCPNHHWEFDKGLISL